MDHRDNERHFNTSYVLCGDRSIPCFALFSRAHDMSTEIFPQNLACILCFTSDGHIVAQPTKPQQMPAAKELKAMQLDRAERSHPSI